jgi:hypothetical protein
MPDAAASRKRQIPIRRIAGDLDGSFGAQATKSQDGETPVRTADLRWAGREVRRRDQDLKRNRTARSQPSCRSLYNIGGRLCGKSESRFRPERQLSLVGMDDLGGDGRSPRAFDSAQALRVRNRKPAFGVPAPRSARQIELFENSLMKQRFVTKGRSQLSVNCATPIQKRLPSQGPKRFLCCVFRGVR